MVGKTRMKAHETYHCVVAGSDGELVGEFLALSELPQKERRTLNVESEIVLAWVSVQKTMIDGLCISR
jgi:hypothetical protein